MSRRRSTRLLAGLAADFDPEDGSDPKEFHRKLWDAPKPSGRKALQLCEQAKRALHLSLAACGDDALQSLIVLRVEPAPNSGRLCVVVGAEESRDRSDVLRSLHRAAGMLRAEVAAAICRRYAPELIFVMEPPESASEFRCQGQPRMLAHVS